MAASGPILVVPGSGRTWFTYLVYVFFFLAAACVLTTIVLLRIAPGEILLDLPGALIGIALALAGIGFFDKIPRELTILPDGFEIRYALSHTRIKWGQLIGFTDARRGFVGLRVAPVTRGVWGALIVTTEQARAILSHPACPHFSLPPDVMRELNRVIQS